MKDFLQLLVQKSVFMKAVTIYSGWLEVDTTKDYELYLRLIEDGSTKEFINLKSKTVGC